MPPPPVLVTGGSGVVGSAVVRRLVATGRPVRALARSEPSAAVVRGLGAEAVEGDVLDVDSLARAMDGCEVVYNVAGVNRFCLRDVTPMRQVNVQGAANCVTAAGMAGLRRIVHTSSAVTIGEPTGTVGREDSVHRGSFLSAYERSKYDAEHTVLGLGAVANLEVVSVNPSSVQGPGRASGTGRILVAYLQGRLRGWLDTTVSLVDIDDCAEGHLLAETAGAPGERYLLSAASLGSDELAAVMSQVAPGVRRPRTLPRPVATLGVAAATVTARARRQDPEICMESLRTLLHGHRYDGSRAERDLGLRYRPVEDTLRRTAEWMVAEGLVPASSLG